VALDATARGVAIVIATLLSSTNFLQAQETGWSNKRQGFWIGFGVGEGSARIDCTYFCGSGRADGASGYLRMGSTLSPHVLVGGEINVWTPSGDITSRVIGLASLVVLWYPSRTGALYLKFGFGRMRYRSYAQVADATSLMADAPGAMFGIGYEVRVRSRVSLVPWIDVLASSRVRLDYNLGFIGPPPAPPDVRINLVQAGLGVTW
jgi:hypothetical protein